MIQFQQKNSQIPHTSKFSNSEKQSRFQRSVAPPSNVRVLRNRASGQGEPHPNGARRPGGGPRPPPPSIGHARGRKEPPLQTLQLWQELPDFPAPAGGRKVFSSPSNQGGR